MDMSAIQRALGRIEGAAFGAPQEVRQEIWDALVVIDEELEEKDD